MLDKTNKMYYNINESKNTAKNTETEVCAMKSTGVVRKVDELVRIVLPIEIRKVLDIKTKDSLEIFTDNDRIVLQKYVPACIFCNDTEDVIYFNGKRVCRQCIKQLKEQI